MSRETDLTRRKSVGGVKGEGSKSVEEYTVEGTGGIYFIATDGYKGMTYIKKKYRDNSGLQINTK